MASLSTQFFAATEELGAFVKGWLARDGIYGAVVEFFPFVVRPVLPEEVDERLANEGVRQVIICERPIDCRAQGNLELLDKNEGALVLQLGRLKCGCLTESHLSTMDATKMWRKFASELKKRTVAGMVEEAEGADSVGFWRAVRYTSGAAQLHASGVNLKQFAQSRVRFHPRAKE